MKSIGNTIANRLSLRSPQRESLEILDRTILVPTHPDHTEAEIADLIHNLGAAARVALGSTPLEEAGLRTVKAIDAQKFDLKQDA